MLQSRNYSRDVKLIESLNNLDLMKVSERNSQNHDSSFVMTRPPPQNHVLQQGLNFRDRLYSSLNDETSLKYNSAIAQDLCFLQALYGVCTPQSLSLSVPPPCPSSLSQPPPPTYPPASAFLCNAPGNIPHLDNIGSSQAQFGPLPSQGTQCTTRLWNGNIEPRNFNSYNRPENYCRKVFIGGISREITTDDVISLFRELDGGVVFEWPENRINSRGSPKGYVYLVMSSKAKVYDILSNCNLSIEGGCETYNFKSKKQMKQLQVIPWLTSDSCFKFGEPTDFQKAKFTVFIGALHGRLHAKAIAYILNDVFGSIISVVIDCDQHGYPTGSGRVTFGDLQSYKSAINANFVYIESKKVSKRIQIEPCIDGQRCSKCFQDDAPNFCKEEECFDYYCNHCWILKHQGVSPLNHTVVRRKTKNFQCPLNF